MTCPDCKGTGKITLLTSVEPCPRCFPVLLCGKLTSLVCVGEGVSYEVRDNAVIVRITGHRGDERYAVAVNP